MLTADKIAQDALDGGRSAYVRRIRGLITPAAAP